MTLTIEIPSPGRTLSNWSLPLLESEVSVLIGGAFHTLDEAPIRHTLHAEAAPSPLKEWQIMAVR